MTDRSYRWPILGLLLVLLAGILCADALAARRARPAPSAAPKAEAGDDDPEDPAQADDQQPLTAPKLAATNPTVQNAAAIYALIDKAGKEPPEWWDAVQLSFPRTLDLSWPIPAPKGPWNPNRNVGQYYISVINPDPSRHQEGCKLMHHILTVNKNNSAVQQRAKAMLGRIYSIYLLDYARGAFWFRRAAASGGLNVRDVADLAFCYWQLGNRAMALATISGASQASGRTVRVLGNMGEVDKALAMAARLGTSAEDAYLAAGDACRYNARYADAVTWYQKLLALRPANAKAQPRLQRYQNRALANIQGVRAFERLDVRKLPDGVYHGESIGYRGPVKVEVTVKAGKMQYIEVIESEEDWPLNALEIVPDQLYEKQSAQGIDMVSGATFTAEAVLNATGKALNAGRVR